MAGIGFRLRELSRQDTLWSTVQVYVSSSLISAGPWIITMLNLFAISLWNPGQMDDVDRATLFCIISYAMGGSFLLTGVFSMAFTRYLADELYKHEEGTLLPALNGLLLILLPIAAVSGYLFLRPLPLHTFVKFLALLLFLTLIILWMMMAYLSILRDYAPIVWAFVIGAVGGWILAFGIAGHIGLATRLGGFLAGQMITVAILAIRMFKELGSSSGIDFAFVRSWSKHWRLLGVGLFYNLGIWIDKYVLWSSDYRVEINGFFVCPFYDTAIFFAQLTMIPTIAMFIVHIETDFYEKFAGFYREAIEKAPLQRIRAAKEYIIQSVRASLASLMKYQGLLTLVALLGSDALLGWCHLDAAQGPLLRIAILGAFVQSIAYVLLIFLLYFDRQSDAFWMSFFFAMGIGLGTWLLLGYGLRSLGYGYFSGCLLALFVGYFGMNRTLKNLEFNTFAYQPMAKNA